MRITKNQDFLKESRNEEVVTAPLYLEIGRLKMELEWLKKAVSLST